MGTRARRDRLQVHHDLPPAVVQAAVPPDASSLPPTVLPTGSPAADLTPPPGPPGPDDVSAGHAGDDDTEEPAMYGVRTSWQSEAVRIEAAEFLVATRVQEDSRRRLARLVARLREQARTDRGSG